MARAGVEFDHTDPALRGPRYWDVVRELRQRHGPLVRVNGHGGYWAAIGYDVVRQIAQDWETFSSGQGVTVDRPDPEHSPYVMPIEIDPPRQLPWRKAVNPHLSPKAVRGLEEGIRGIADGLIDAFIEQGSCNVAVDFARRLPGTVFFQLVLGEEGEDFRRVEPWHQVMAFDPDPMKKAEAARHVRDWAAGVCEARGSEPDGSGVVHAMLDLAARGEFSADHELYSGLSILAQGGIGTSSQLIGSIMCILCRHPDLQERVRNDLSLVPALVEEGLRTEPPVSLIFRTATRDVEIAGQHILEGDKVGLFFGAANRDPAAFDHPDEVDIDRRANPHLGFGLGVHRCVGSNLARLQVRVAIEQLVSRLSPFRIPEGASVEYMSEQERGPSSIPLEFTPGHQRTLSTTA